MHTRTHAHTHTHTLTSRKQYAPHFFKVGGINKKIIFFFFRFSPTDLLITLYQLTKFEAPSCYTFGDIMITNFQSPNLQREIIRKK